MRPSPHSLALTLVLASLTPACGTIFPRFHTATRVPPAGVIENGALRVPPDNVRRLVFVSGELAPSRPDGRTWDEDGDADLYVVLYRNGEELYRTPVASNSLRPSWHDASVTVRMDPRARTRLELRDDDGAVSDLVAAVEFSGVPQGAMEGSNLVIRMENGAVVRIRSLPPEVRVGMGVEYEIHETFVKVLGLDADSPGSIAGLQVGDRILGIDGRSVESLGEVGSRQGMDRACLRNVSLTVQRGDRPAFVVDVRLDAVYPAR